MELDLLCDIPLQIRVDKAIVIASAICIEVEIFVNKLYISTGHLQHWQTDDLIVCRSKPLSFVVLEVLRVDLEIEVNAERPKMRDFLWDIAVHIALFLFVCVSLGPSVFDEIVQHPILKRNRVSHRWLLCLVHSIENFECLSTDKLIITIHEESNLIMLAVLGNSVMYVRNGSDSFGIDDHLDLRVADVVLFKEPADEQSGVVVRSVIYNDYVVVLVILVEDALDVELIPEVLGILVGWNNDAKRQLLSESAQVISLFEPALLLLVEVLDCLELLFRHVIGVNIGALHQPVIFSHWHLEILVFLGQFLKFTYSFLLDALFQMILNQIYHQSILFGGLLQTNKPIMYCHFIQRYLFTNSRLQCENLSLKGLCRFINAFLFDNDGVDEFGLILSRLVILALYLRFQGDEVLSKLLKVLGVFLVGMRHRGELVLHEHCDGEEEEEGRCVVKKVFGLTLRLLLANHQSIRLQLSSTTYHKIRPLSLIPLNGQNQITIALMIINNCTISALFSNVYASLMW